MKIDPRETRGACEIFVDEDNSSVYVRLIKENNIIGMGDGNPHQFTGRQYDAESGLYHYRARAYSPDIGRFMQQDPAGMVDGANMYAYCGNDPVNGKAPSGRWIEDSPPIWPCLDEIDPRTGEPVPDGMYFDWITGEYRECPYPQQIGPEPFDGYGYEALGALYSGIVQWSFILLKSLWDTNPFEGHDYRPPVAPYGDPTDQWEYIGKGTRINIYHR